MRRNGAAMAADGLLRCRLGGHAAGTVVKPLRPFVVCRMPQETAR